MNPQLVNILSAVFKESLRAQEKHGVQLHIPSIDVILKNRSKSRICEHYEIPHESRAKYMTDTATKNKELTWAHIAVEELSEAICAKNELDMRTELIQLMSVCHRWIEAIDARCSSCKRPLPTLPLKKNE